MIRQKQIRHVFILGMGVSGLSLALFLSKKKINYSCWDDDPKVRVIAEKKKLQIRKVSEENLKNCDFLVLSPGINHLKIDRHKAVIIAMKLKIKITTDLEFLRVFNLNNNLIGVTGTNGKSTTTNFIEKVISYDNFIESASCGNIGTPFTDLKIKNNTTLIVEASSFQLSKIHKLKFNYAFLLNISDDHLDWHGSMKNYINSKLKIFKNQDQSCYAIICIDDSHTRKVASNFRKKFKSKLLCISTENPNKADIYLESNNKAIRIINFISNENIIIPYDHIKFTKAKHNFCNLLCAYTASFLLKQKKEKFIESVKFLGNLEHRIEFIGNLKEVNFFNDSKSTNVNSAKTAINSFSNIFWILGGRQKKGGLKGIENNLDNVVQAYSFGESREKIKSFLNYHLIKCRSFKTLEEALNQAFKDTNNHKQKSNIILSPACSSYDQFKNFEVRGNKFRELVKAKLKKYGK